MRKKLSVLLVAIIVVLCAVPLSIHAESFRKYYANGTLIRQKDSLAVWLSEGTRRRLIPSPEIFESQFKWNNIVEVNEIPDDFEIGDEVKYPDGTLLMSKNGTVYIVTNDGFKRGFISKEIFEGLGYKYSNVIMVSDAELAKYPDTDSLNIPNYLKGPIINTDFHPVGTLINVGGIIYRKGFSILYCCDGVDCVCFDNDISLQGIPSPKVFEINNFKWDQVVLATEEDKKTRLDFNVTFPDGTLLKGKSSLTVYLMEYGQKTPFHTANEFLSQGYKWGSIVEVNNAELNAIPNRVYNLDCLSESGC